MKVRKKPRFYGKSASLSILSANRIAKELSKEY